ncbi:hypothetical protein EVAR_19684_1 [Eumeta japonica]|uniref:Uncharacterized protein n=1 Tax=Eumeta variegata TaxID=151549 RepID=A0A4C1V3K3_EUMVA|nr:hypothetical protein EVAR_19684_1 [Eumeta japonica]
MKTKKKKVEKEKKKKLNKKTYYNIKLQKKRPWGNHVKKDAPRTLPYWWHVSYRLDGPTRSHAEAAPATFARAAHSSLRCRNDEKIARNRFKN